MDFNEIKKLEKEEERVQKTYAIFREEHRLTHSKAAQVEFLTGIKYMDEYLKKDARILDIGAGAGIYSLHYAKLGYHVDALELSSDNIEVFQSKITPGQHVDLRQGNALDLSYYKDETFDVVLLMGPLYHLSSFDDQLKALNEAKRVLKKDGVLFATFISNDMVYLTELEYDIDFFESDQYNHDTFDLVDFPFVFHTLDEAKHLIDKSGLLTHKIIAQDGISELMSKTINQLSEKSYQKYLAYHFYCAEKAEMLGRSNHIMFILEKH